MGTDPAAVREAQVERRNEVRLRGKLTAAASVRALPSGDELVVWRLVVSRPEAAIRRPNAPSVDTLECHSWDPAVGRHALRWSPGEFIEVEGELRRRFWRAPTGAVSRCEVEVTAARRVRARSGKAAAGGSRAAR
jgi:single-strand DNA-binding protein